MTSAVHPNLELEGELFILWSQLCRVSLIPSPPTGSQGGVVEEGSAGHHCVAGWPLLFTSCVTVDMLAHLS